MRDKEFNLQFNANLDIKNMRTSLDQINKLLNNTNIKLPQSIANNLSKLTNTLNVELNKIEGLSDQTLDSKKVKQISTSYDKVFSTFQQMKVLMKGIGRDLNIDASKFFPETIGENIAAASKALQKYKKAIEQGPNDDSYKENARRLKESQKKELDFEKRQDEQRIKQNAALSRKAQLKQEKAKKEEEKKQADERASNFEREKEQAKAQTRTLRQQEALRKKIAENKEKEDKANEKAEAAFEKMSQKKRTDTKVYADLERSYEANSQEAQRAKNRREALEAELAASETASERIVQAEKNKAKAQEDSAKAAKEIKNIQTQINRQTEVVNQTGATYNALADGISEAKTESKNLTDELKRQEQAFEQQNLDELIAEFEKLGISIPKSAHNLEGVEKAFNQLSNETKNKLVAAFEEAGISVKELGLNLKNTGDKVDSLLELESAAERSAREMKNLEEDVLHFFSISNTIQIFKNAVHDAIETVKELDAVMTETAVVTDFSIGDMWEKLPEYSAEATKLGTSIKSLYEATTLYYQQGLNSQQAMNVGTETMKMARIANLDAADATKAMTAALRGFNMEINEVSAQHINDVYSELAAITAADTSQIATAMTKTASIASSANMEFETTAALLAQIIETTQEAPETAGTAMKTIIARFTEVKELFSQGQLTGEDEEGEIIDINKIDTALKKVGISLKDFLNGTKGIDDIFLELASKWDSLDLATQRYIATTAAGSRQQSRFIAMMSNYDRTMELVNAANNSAGASQEQFNKTLDSLEAKLQRLNNAWQEFTMGLANNQVIKAGVDILTLLLETINKITGVTGGEGLGGLVTTFIRFLTVISGLKLGKTVLSGFLKTFSKQGSESTEVVNGLKKAFYDLSNTSKEIGSADSIGKIFELLKGGGAGAKEALGQQFASWGTFISNSLKEVGTAITKFGFGKFAFIVAGVVAAFFLLKKAFEAIQASTPEGKLQAAQLAAEEAGKAATTAAESFNSLKSALDSLSGGYSALDKLTRGTQEWNDAVQDLNSQVLNLVEKYPELGAFITSEGGVMKLDYSKVIERNNEKVSVESILREYANKTYATSAAKNLADFEVIQKQKEIDYNDVSSKYMLVNSGRESLSPEDTIKLKREIIDKLSKELATDINLGGLTIQEWLNKMGYTGLKLETQDDPKRYRQNLVNYGQQQLQNEKKQQLLQDNAIFNAMSMANLSGSIGDLVSNIDKDFLRPTYENLIEANKEKYKEITDLDKQRYANEMGYEYDSATRKFTDSSGEERTVTNLKIREYLASIDATTELAKTLEDFQDISLLNIKQDLLKEVTSEEGQEISKQTLLKYANFNTGTGTFDFDKNTWLNDIGIDDETLKDLFGENYLDELVKNFESAGDRILKQRKELVVKMSKYSKTSKKGYEDDAKNLELFEQKFGEDYVSTLENVFTLLEKTGDDSLISSAFSAFEEISLKGTLADVEDTSNFISGIDWTNPIEAAYSLNQEMKNGQGASKTFAIRMKELDAQLEGVGSSFLDASSQMQYFFTSTDWNEMQEDFDEIVEANGEIAATDVLELSKKYKLLGQLLKNTGLNASAAGKLIQQMSEEKISVYQLTDAVLAAIDSFGGLESTIVDVLDSLENLDLGVDENEIAGYVEQYYDVLKANLQKGAIGNTQNFRILDYFFGPDWDKDLDGKELEGSALFQKMTALAKQLGKNTTDMRASWVELAKMAKTSPEVQAALGDLQVQNVGNKISLTGFDDMSIDEMTDRIAKAYGVSKRYAEMMLTDFKNTSLDLAPELEDKYYEQAIDSAIGKLKTISGDKLKFIDESEIDAIATYYGESLDKVRQDFENKGIQVTSFFDEYGILKKTDDLLPEIDKMFKKAGGKGKWAEQFYEDGKYNITKLTEALAKLGIPQESLSQVTEEVARSIGIGIETGSEEGGQVVEAILSDGEKHTIELNPNISLEQAIKNAEQELQNSNLAKAIADAFKDTTITLSSEVEIPENLEVKDKNNMIYWGNIYDTPQNLTAKGTIKWELGELPEGVIIKKEGESEAGGTARAGGTFGSTSGGDTLVGEIKRELVVDPHSGRWYTVGDNGAEFVNLPKDAIVFNHRQTDQLLKNGRISGRGKTHASGRAFAYGYNTEWGYKSGGKNSDEKWHSTLDKLYNLIRNINEEQRQRNRIEHRYEKMLKSININTKGIVDISRQELNQLEFEKNLQKELIAERKQQILAYQAERDMTEYAWTELNEYGEQILRVNWDLIDAIEDEDKGSKVEEYVTQLEEWIDSANEAQDTLDEIQDTVEEIKTRGEDEYFDLEEKIKDAVIHSREQEIEELEKINDSVNDVNNDIVDAIQKSIDRQRQERSNQKTEQDLADKQRRLARLQQDTSGANDLEILRLQKEIEEETEDYTDTLIDQKISQLQDQNEKASEQRQWQIELAQQQLEQYINSGRIWEEVYQLMDEGLDKEHGLVRGSRLEDLLKSEEGFSGLSKIGQMVWLKELTNLIAQGLGYLEIGRQLEDLQGQEGIPKAGEQIEFYKDGQLLVGTVNDDGSVKVGDEVYNNVYQGYDGKFYAGENYEIKKPKPITQSNNSNDNSNGSSSSSGPNSGTGGSGGSTEPIYYNEKIKELQDEREKVANDSTLTFSERSEEIKKIDQQIEKENKKTELIKQKERGKKGPKEMAHYRTGGLADFTGPAWLDGTKAKPEYVLNSVQTQSFLKLVDILDTLRKETSFASQAQKTVGDTYDIDINIETVREEADVDMIAEKVQKSIVAASKYRNNNYIKR